MSFLLSLSVQVVYEAVQGSTKLDVDLTDQTDKRYPGYVTVRKGNQAQCITYGQWFDAEKSASLVSHSVL